MTEEKVDNQVLEEELLSGEDKPFEIPKWLRITASVTLLLILLVSLAIL